MNTSINSSGEHIVSYDSNKTWIINKNNDSIFCKKTSYNECSSLKILTKLLKDKYISINGNNFYFHIPKIISWDSKNSILQLEYCNGVNLEFLLRNINTHEYGLKLLDGILEFLINNKIYWNDFAPRNIIINNNTIILVDFEKGISSKNIKLVDYFRNHIYEEYCLFLLIDERKKYVDNLFEIGEKNNSIILIEDIESDRIKEIAKLIYNGNSITKKEYLNILKIIIEVETPELINNNFVFPGVILDKFMQNTNSKTPVVDYAKEVIKMYKAQKKNAV